MRPRTAALALLLLIGSCIGGDEATGPEGYAELDLAIQPALIPSAADASALPIHRIHTVVARQPDGAVLREQRFDVSPTAASWTLDVRVPVGPDATEVVVYLHLLHVAGDGTEAVQFSGRTPPLTVSLGSRVDDVGADIVRGPLSNLAVTGVSIVSAPDTLFVGETSILSAAAAFAVPTPVQVFWTSLDPAVLGMVDSVATGLQQGTAAVVASAGAFADTVTVEVIAAAPSGGAANSWNGGSGNWSTASSWSLDRVPAADDTVRIEQGGDYTVALDVDATIAKLVIGGTSDVVDLSVGGRTLTITGSVVGPELEIHDLGGVEITNGSIVVNGLANDGNLRSHGVAAVQADSILNLGNWTVADGVQAVGAQGGSVVETLGAFVVGADAALQFGASTRLIDNDGTFEGTGMIGFAQGSVLELQHDLQLDGPTLILQDASITSDPGHELRIGEASALHVFASTQTVEIAPNVAVDGQLSTSGPDIRLLGSLTVGPTGSVLLGVVTGTADEIFVQQDVVLAGELLVAAQALSASPGDRFPILTYEERTGTFDAVTVSPPAGVQLDTLWVEADGVRDTLYLVASAAVPAPVTSWINPAGGSWSTPTNWSGGVVPAATDSVAIDLAGTYTVTLDVSPSVRNLTVGGSSGTQTLSSTAARTLTIDGASAVYANGQLSLTNSSIAGSGTLTNHGTMSFAGGTVSAPLTNSDGQIGTSGTVSFTGIFENLEGASLTLGALAGHSTLTVQNGFTNSGTIELSNTGAAYNATLAVVNGTLVNQGTVVSLAGNGGARTLEAELDNQGTLTLDHPLTIDADDAAHVNRAAIAVATDNLLVTQSAVGSFTNTGTISIANGLTFTVTGGSIDFDQGLVDGAGTLSVAGAATYAFLTSTVTAPMVIASTVSIPSNVTVPSGETLTLLNGTVIDEPIVNEGTTLLAGNVTFNGPLTMASGSLLRLGALPGHTTVIVQNGFTNEGTIELTNTGAAYNATLAVMNGTLVNQGVVVTLPGNGGARTLDVELDNQGTLTLDHPLTIARAGAAHVNHTTIDIATDDLTITQTPVGSFTNTGDITVASGRTFTLSGGTVDLDQGTVSGAGTLSITGTAIYEFLTSAVTTPMMIAETVTIPANVTVPTGQTLTLLSGSVIDEPIANQGTTLLTGNVTFNGPLTMPIGSLLRLGALAGHTTLTVLNGFANEGTIELTNSAAAYNAFLVVTDGTLVNQGTLRALPGNGGARTLVAELDNQGVLTLDHPLTIDRPDAAHWNRVAIDIAAGNLAITQSAGGSFTNTGAITIASGRTFTLTGGTVDLDQGSVSGPGTLSIAGTATYGFLTSTVTTPMLIAGTVTIPDSVSVPSGETLTLLGGSAIDEPIDNQGTILIQGSASFLGALTMPPGSLLRVGALPGHSQLFIQDGFTNEGTIELTNVGAAYDARLGIVSGSLINEGVVRSSPGNGGARFLSLELVNDGVLEIDHPLTIDGAFTTHVNNATIDISTDDLEVLQSAEGSFTNNGTINVASGRTFRLTGGFMDLSTGTLSGAGTLVVGTGTDLAFTTSTMTTPLQIFAGATISSDLTVPPGDSLSLVNGSVIDEPIDNQGTILTAGDVTLNGPLTTNGLIRVGAFAGHSLLTVTSDFTNGGVIELTNVGAAYDAQLAITSGALTNEGTLSFLQNLGGSRILAAQLANSGDVNVDANTTFASTLLQLGSALLTVSANRTLNVTGAMVLLEGSTTTAIGTLNPNGGCSAPQGGANISGFTCVLP